MAMRLILPAMATALALLGLALAGCSGSSRNAVRTNGGIPIYEFGVSRSGGGSFPVPC